ncbi:MAG: NF038129 family PEP-CTERM protein [Chthoniobacteraceae bacterium]
MIKFIRTSILTAGLFAGLLVSAQKAEAANFTFHLTLNTSALASAANGPFYLDFQLSSGGASATNTVTLSNFSFAGGSATAGTVNTNGTASGSLSSSVTLSDSSSSPFNEFYQGFSLSTSSISFDVTTTQSIVGTTPDGFAVSILDSESGNPQIYTNAPDTASLVLLNIGSSNKLSDVQTYSSTSPVGVTTVAAVPEPSAFLCLLGGAALLAVARPRRHHA